MKFQVHAYIYIPHTAVHVHVQGTVHRIFLNTFIVAWEQMARAEDADRNVRRRPSTIPSRGTIPWHCRLLPFLAFPICQQDGQHPPAQAYIVGSPPARCALPRQRWAHRSLSLKSVRLCFWMCLSKTFPRLSSVSRTCFRPLAPPWLSQNTWSICSDLSSMFCRHPDARTFTTDSGNLGPKSQSPCKKGKA